MCSRTKIFSQPFRAFFATRSGSILCLAVMILGTWVMMAAMSGPAAVSACTLIYESDPSGFVAGSTQMESGLAFVPVLVGGKEIFAPHFSATGNFMFAVQEGAIFLQAGATANYEFKVPVGQSLTVAYGIPTGGRLNSAPAEISVNGVTLETIDKDRDYVWGAITPRQRLLWHKSFGPGNYVVTIRSGGVAVNFYGLWVGAPQSIAPAPPTFPAPTLKPVYQVNCGGERVESFSADKFFSGGRTYTTTDGITTTRVRQSTSG